jgi:hypothetical protein
MFGLSTLGNLFRKDPVRMNVIEDLSFLTHEPEAEYRARAGECLTSHDLNRFRQDPYLFHKRLAGLLDEDDRRAFSVGRAAHTLILEGRERYLSQHVFDVPVNPKTGQPFGRQTNAFRDWAVAQDRPIIDPDDARLIDNLESSVRSHTLASDLLSEGVAEGVVRTGYCGLPCQGRLDWLNPRQGLVDLKTCDNLTYLEGAAKVYGYIHQMAFYRALIFQATGRVVPAHLIAVEKREPFRCGVWVITSDVLSAAQKENEQAIERLKECRARDSWPTGYEELRTFDYL